MRLILVRHPRPLIAQGICYGSSDIQAEPEHQAQALSKLLAALPADAALIASPLRRCAELATQLAAQRDASLIFDKRLAEMDFGSWEMRPWADIPRAEIDAWAADIVHYRPGDGENVLDVASRVSAFHTEAQRQQRDTIVICHAGTMRLLAACQQGLSLQETALRAAQTPHQIPYGTIRIMHI